MSTSMDEEWWEECKDLSLVQGTKEWKAARRERIGGSEIGVIMRLSPYKTRLELWEEKMGFKNVEDISNMPHVKRGIDAEPIARGILERIHGVRYLTPVLKHKEYPFCVASLDGLCPDHMLEIKTMGKQKHLEVGEGIVPDYYEMQCQWGMMISGVDKCLFASYRPEDGSMNEFWIRSDLGLQRRALAHALVFHKWIKRGIAPRDVIQLELDL